MASELDIVVVIPELTTSVEYPGVTTNVNNLGVQPNGKSSLTTNVTIDGLSTAVTQPSLSSAIQQEVPLTATVTGVVNSIPTPGLFTRALDTVTISAPAYITVQKPFTESITIADTTVVLLQFNRNFLETLVTSSTAVFEISSILENTSIVADEFYKSFLKAADSQATNLVDLNYWQIFKVFENGVVNTSFNTLLVGKNAVDTVSITDVDNITTITDYIRTLEELVDITDDYYGAATIGDDEYAYFGKVVVDSTLNTETISNYITSVQLNTAQTIDQNYYLFTKLLADSSSSLVEDTNFNVGKAIQEFGNIAETSSVNVQLTKTDSGSISELFTRVASYIRNNLEITNSSDTAAKYIAIQKQSSLSGISDVFNRFIYWMREFTTDIITSNDYSYYTARKTVVETKNILDLKTLVFNKITSDITSSYELLNYKIDYVRSFEDYLDATDDYYGAATIGDDEYASFNKVTVDNLLIVDINVFSTAKVLTDTATSLESLANRIEKISSSQLYATETSSKIINSVQLDSNNTSDQKYFNISSILDTSTNNTELFTRLVNYIRSFTDITNTQDLTAKYAQIVKADSTNNTDTITKLVEFYRQLLDSIQSSESSTTSVSKLLLDIGTTSEAKAANVNKPLLDAYSVVDLFTRSLSYNRSFEDFVDITDDYYGAATIGDDEYANFNKVVSDSVIKIDTTKFDIVKILQDIGSSIDSSKYTFTKPVTEVVASAELSEKSANILQLDFTNLYNSDTKQFAVKPNKFDSILFTDILTYLKSTGNLLTDLIHLTDSGTINNQNYFASSYVTPGYAGTNVNFGT